jgi:hypothetical protein
MNPRCILCPLEHYFWRTSENPGPQFIVGALWLILMVIAILVILKVPALRNRARFIAGVLWLILMVFIILVFLNTPGIR